MNLNNLNNKHKIIKLSWNDLESIIFHTASLIKEDGLPDIIIGIHRGGTIPSIMLSHSLNIRDCFTFNIIHTKNDDINSSKLIKPIMKNNLNMNFLRDKDVLFIDDIVGSGKTFTTIKEEFAKYDLKRFRSSTCVLNLDNWEKDNISEPDITYISRLVRGWVIFPWENMKLFN